MTEREKPKSPLRLALEAYAFLGGLGFYMAAVLAVCIFLGHLADKYLTGGNMGKMAGILLGFPIAIYSVYRKLKQK